MKRFLTSTLVLVLLISLFNLPAFATSVPQYAADGTLILDKYPEMPGTAEKQTMAATYAEYLKGEATESEVSSALEAFYTAVGDTEAAENVGQESLFVVPTSNSISLMSTNTVTPYNKSITGFTQFPQENGYYCGPATAKEILYSLLGTSYAQSTLATSLGTTSSGTAWYTNTYPMANTLNSYASTTWYLATATPSVSDLQADVVTDISNDHGVAANINISSSTTTRPTGYPSSGSIAHWVAIYGYTNSGSTIKWADPAYNGTGVSSNWSLSSGYMSDSSTNVASYVSNRGIIW